jgi:hypothetical protein
LREYEMTDDVEIANLRGRIDGIHDYVETWPDDRVARDPNNDEFFDDDPVTFSRPSRAVRATPHRARGAPGRLSPRRPDRRWPARRRTERRGMRRRRHIWGGRGGGRARGGLRPDGARTREPGHAVNGPSAGRSGTSDRRGARRPSLTSVRSADPSRVIAALARDQPTRRGSPPSRRTLSSTCSNTSATSLIPAPRTRASGRPGGDHEPVASATSRRRYINWPGLGVHRG